MIYSISNLASSVDIYWMIEQSKNASLEQANRLWSQLIECSFDRNDLKQIEAIYNACQENFIMAETFTFYFEPLKIDSPVALKLKIDYFERKEGEERHNKQPLLEPSLPERIKSLLERCESGDSVAWWHLNMEMTIKPDTAHYGDEWEPDLTVLPGWLNIDSNMRMRIVEAAKRYLIEHDPETNKWIGTNTMYRPAFAGYRALYLLLQEYPDYLYVLSNTIWGKWASIIIAYPVSSGLGEEGLHNKLISLAYKNAPEQIIENLLIMIDKENNENSNVYITSKLKECWDSRLASILIDKVKDPNLKPASMGCLLSELLDHNIMEVRVIAESMVSLVNTGSEKERLKAITASQLLMTHTNDCGWSIVWPVINMDEEFGREVIIEVLKYTDCTNTPVAGKLSERQLAELYVWLVHKYPYKEDPEHEDTYILGPREMVARKRDSILQQLKMRGTNQACEEIKWIMKQFPEIDWLKWTLLEAEKHARQCTWVPLMPGDVIKIIKHNNLRVIHNGDQLLEVLIESLQELEKDLQGETPIAIFLWNECGKNIYKPKSENRFSDFIKYHLDRIWKSKGIIINREVEIRAGFGTGQGERTDIRVDAVIRNSNGEINDVVTVIIEVKGCWHSELKTAMKTQLVDRYLKDNRSRHGLYLVGWFNCDQWDEKDYKRAIAPKIGLNELKEQLDNQAEEVSQQNVKVRALVINAALR